MYRAIIIDDEQDAVSLLESLIKTNLSHEIEIVGQANSVVQAIKEITTHQPDLIFLDIQLGDGTGFDILDQVNANELKVIFTTAFDEYAVKAFDYHTIHYLLKPISLRSVIKAVSKIHEEQNYDQLLQKIQSVFGYAPSTNGKNLTICSLQGIEIIPIRDILYIQADGSYCSIYKVGNECIMASKTLKDVEEILPSSDFIRVHKGYLINKAHLKRYLREDGGYVVMTNKSKIPVSRRKKDLLMTYLGMKM